MSRVSNMWSTWVRGAALLRRSIALLTSPAPSAAIAYFLLVLLSSLLPVLGAWIFKVMLDLLAAQYEAALLAALLYAVTIVLPLGLDPVQQALSSWLEARATAEVDLRLMRAGMNLVDLEKLEQPSFHDQLRMTQEIPGLLPRMISDFRTVVGSLVTFIGLLALLVSLNPLLPILLAALTVPRIMLEVRSIKLLYWTMFQHSRAAREMDYCLRVVTEPSSAKELRVFGLGEYFLGRFRDRSWRALKEMTSIRLRQLSLSFGLNILYALAVGGGLWYVATQAGSGGLTIGDVGLYVNSVVQAQMLLHQLPDGLRSTYQTLLHMQDFFAMLDGARPRIKMAGEGKGLPMPARLRAGLELRNVTFTYPGSTKPVLSEVSFTIPSGKITALVGSNGAGKSTIIKLLSRMYDPTDGEILLDRVPIWKYDLEAYRRGLAVVYQDHARFALTLGENIGVGGGDPVSVPREMIEHAGRLAGVEELAKGLASGYDTPMGRMFEGGLELSGGQWQRVALSRGVLRVELGALVVLLDEPTSALDAEAEEMVLRCMRELMIGRTVLVISHRLSLVKSADQIVVLDGGRVVEVGSHVELVGRGGVYAGLFELQARRYR